MTTLLKVTLAVGKSYLGARQEQKQSLYYCSRQERVGMAWTRVVAAEMGRNKEIHLYLEVEPTAPAEGPAVDRGGSWLTLRARAGLFVPPSMQATFPCISPGTLMVERLRGSFFPASTHL